jgi:HlyD family secretion protein
MRGRQIVVLAVTLLLTPMAHNAAEATDGETGVPVRAATVVRERVPAGRIFIGTVEAARRTVVGSSVSGRVEEVFAEEGDAVDPTDAGHGRIVQLELRTIKTELAAALADRDVAFHELDELLKGPRNVVVARLAAEVERAQVRLQNESQRLGRLERLVEKNSAGQGDLDQVRATHLAAEQTQLIARLLHKEAQLGTRPEKIAQAQARLARAEEEMNRFQTLLSEHTVRAPFRGYVISRRAEKGTWIQQGDPVAEIIEVDPVEIRVSVPEAVISRIHQQERVRIHVDAARTSEHASGSFQGTIHRIIPSADTRTRSFPVRIRLPNVFLDGLPVIRPGMMSQVTLPVGPREDALLIPRDALVLDGDRTSIFVLDASSASGNAREIGVKIGSAHGLRIQVEPLEEGQLAAGMQVITEGNERLKTGQLVRILADRLPESKS